MASNVNPAAGPGSKLPQHTVIVGGGIIGASTLYYAARHPARTGASKLTLIEGSRELAPGASGKAGGFLALDWHGDSTSSLAELSYRLHCELAEEGRGAERWGYRSVETLQVNMDTNAGRSRCPKELHWVDAAHVISTSKLGTHRTTAQVTPKSLVEYLVEQAQKEDHVSARLGITATRLVLDEDGKVQGLHVRALDGGEERIDCDRVVLAAGPWTGSLLKSLLAEQSFSKIAPGLLRNAQTIGGSRAHSVVVRGGPTSDHCLFTDIRYTNKTNNGHIQAGAPEVYPRSDGTVYVCGGSDDVPLPATADEVAFDEKQTAKLVEQLGVISPAVVGEKAQVDKEQACYLPGGSFNGPLIDGSADHGLFVAAGHTCWGITLGPGTGKVVSEMLFEGKAVSADVSRLRA